MIKVNIDVEWMDKFRQVILHYNENRISDPFMEWYREQDRKKQFDNTYEKVLIVLIDARFDQQTKAENALENTKRVFKAGVLEKRLKKEKLPILIPRYRKTAEEWTDLFYSAMSRLNKLSKRIVEKRNWSATDLLNSMSSHKYKVPYLGVKTSRLAVRWLHELVLDLKIDMSDYKIPIDVLVYRVASRLGLIDPNVDIYNGEGSPADLKIQSFAKTVFPENPWFLDEPLWSMGRQASSGGHCYPTKPLHTGCIFETICPKKHVNFNPSTVGMDLGRYKRTKKTRIARTAESNKTDIPVKRFEINMKVKQITNNEELEQIHLSKKGFIYNDFSGTGGRGDYNILHAAYCHWITKSNVNVPKYFFDSLDQALIWLDSNRGKEGEKWKRCGTCKAKPML